MSATADLELGAVCTTCTTCTTSPPIVAAVELAGRRPGRRRPPH